MPIVFPRGAVKEVVEKVVEKIVEKTEYVVISLAKRLTVAYSIIANPSKPSPIVVASLTASLRKLLYALRVFTPKPSFTVISNPLKPALTVVAMFQTFIRRECRDGNRISVGYSRVVNPAKPSVTLISSFTTSVTVRKTP